MEAGKEGWRWRQGQEAWRWKKEAGLEGWRWRKKAGQEEERPERVGRRRLGSGVGWGMEKNPAPAQSFYPKSTYNAPDKGVKAMRITPSWRALCHQRITGLQPPYCRPLTEAKRTSGRTSAVHGITP